MDNISIVNACFYGGKFCKSLIWTYVQKNFNIAMPESQEKRLDKVSLIYNRIKKNYING